MNKLDFCIVGAQKSGSSSLSEVLREIPGIWMPKLEISTFQDPFYSSGAIERFLKNIPIQSENCLLGIKCPDYLCLEYLPKRLFDHNPDMKIIVLLRDRASRLVSAAFWYMQIGLIKVQAIDVLIEELISNQDTYEQCIEGELLKYGRYGQGLQAYLEYFDSSKIFVARNTALQEQPKGVVGATLEFFGLKYEVIRSLPLSSLDSRKKRSVYNPFRLKYLAFSHRTFFFKFKPYEDSVSVDLRPKLYRIFFYLLKAVDKYVFALLCHEEKPSLSFRSEALIERYYRKDEKILRSILSKHDLEVGTE